MNTLAVVGIKNLLGSNNHEDINNNEEIISRLKFIGFVEKDEKINVKKVNRQPNDMMTKVIRTIFYPDNRHNTIKFIKSIVDRSFEIAELALANNNNALGKSIITDLVKSKIGIGNIKQTYLDDTKFCCDIQVIIEQIDIKLVNLIDKYKVIIDCIETEQSRVQSQHSDF